MENNINFNEYKYSVIVGRFQCDQPHDGHMALLNEANKNHPEMIIFLGIEHIQNTEKDPLNFNIRKMMMQELFPQATILPIKNNFDDKKWDEDLDSQIELITNGASCLLYGSRDSFIKTYKGKYKTYEFESFDVNISATERRNKIAQEEINDINFRKGIINSKVNQRASVYPTVDIAIYNEKGQILLGRKPYENKFRFIGGFVDPSDLNYEQAGRRELMEEAGNIEVSALNYVCSMKIDDPRYKGLKSGIMTTLLIGQYIYGEPKAGDDIAEVKFFDIDKINIENDIMPVHHELITELFRYIGKKFLIPFK